MVLREDIRDRGLNCFLRIRALESSLVIEERGPGNTGNLQQNREGKVSLECDEGFEPSPSFVRPQGSQISQVSHIRPQPFVLPARYGSSSGTSAGGGLLGSTFTLRTQRVRAIATIRMGPRLE
jgi:hypothetical protein